MRKGQDWAVYRPPHPALRNEGLNCLGAGEQSGALRTIYGRELNSYALVVISAGQGKVWGPDGMGSAAAVTAPACFWIPPSLKYGYGPGAEGWTEHWMVFSGATTSALQSLGVLHPESALHPKPLLDDQAITMFAFLDSALSKAGPAGDLRASALALLIISACMGWAARRINWCRVCATRHTAAFRWRRTQNL
ncbi:hypothetical protein BJ994_002759 [Arthrobacter pigmenti]|uniref:AraC-type arabinose-binding/dimerisation domain-containing protein n=1 Tax=Arthrobacter pigmenti TaxID=271432 RepID=A0A846RKB6_9MICC|nr:AraC family ligand binding domain-containing protein [Arthrobacter pigmenti]NJC23683.1 hypothetical protein [Arthrobacter pigmenti]